MFVFSFNANYCFKFWRNNSSVSKFPVKYVLEILNRILFYEDVLLKVSTVKSSSWILLSDVEHIFWTVFLIQIRETDCGWWTWRFWGSDVLILWMYEVKYLSLLEFPLLFSSELDNSAGAELMESCASVPAQTQCHRQIPAAGIYKYAILLTMLSDICTVVQRKPFIRALWCVSHVLHVLLCATTAMVLLWLPSLPVFEEVWFWVLLNSIGYLLHLPCAALAPSPALNSVWCFGSKELFSPTDLDLRLGNSGEGKQPPGSGRCLVRTPDRRRGHPALDLLMMGLLSIASTGQWAQGGSGCCRGAKGCGQEVLWGWWGNPLRQRTSVEIFLRSREECKNRGR